MNLEERVELLEFQVKLLFNNTELDRFFYETQVTKKQYDKIMDLMDSFRDKIDNGKHVYHGEFESLIYEIVPHKNGDYHFCEYVAKGFAENHQWEEVFYNLYGDMPKYSYLKKQ